MTKTATSYDELFRALVSNPRRAAALLRDHLPNEVAALIDPDVKPELIEGTFIDGKGARTQCDALFKVWLKSGQEACIFVLLEHKSRAESSTPLQIARYMLNIWSRKFEEGGASRKLPFIFPICFYHGRSRWSVPLSLAELIETPDGVSDPLNGFAYFIRDLGAMDPLSLSRDPEVLSGLLALWLAYKPEIPPELLDKVTGGPGKGSDYESLVLRFLAERLNLTRQEFEASLRRTKPEMREILMGTVAQAWKEEAKIEGKAETLLRLAQLKFTTVPDGLEERVKAAGAEQLDIWLDALILASDLDAVFSAEGDGG